MGAMVLPRAGENISEEERRGNSRAKCGLRRSDVCEGQVVFGTRRAALGNDDVIAHCSHCGVRRSKHYPMRLLPARSRKRPVMHQDASNSLKPKRIAGGPSKRHELRDEQSRDYMFRAWAWGAARFLRPDPVTLSAHRWRRAVSMHAAANGNRGQSIAGRALSPATGFPSEYHRSQHCHISHGRNRVHRLTSRGGASDPRRSFHAPAQAVHPTVRTIKGLLALSKEVKNVRQELLRDTGTGVPYRYRDLFLIYVRGQRNAAARRRVFDGVVEHIYDHLRQARRISA
jgi:hypothetical protein